MITQAINWAARCLALGYDIRDPAHARPGTGCSPYDELEQLFTADLRASLAIREAIADRMRAE